MAARQLLITIVMAMRVVIRSNSTRQFGRLERQHGMVGRDDLAGRRKWIVAVGDLIRGRDRKVVDPRGAGEVAEIDDPGNAGMGFGVDDDVMRVEVVMDGL